MDRLEMMNAYKEYSATDNYIIGGVCGNEVKMYITNFDGLTNNILFDKGSNKENNAMTMRFSFCGWLKRVVTKNGITIGTKEELETLAKEYGNNKGKAFEYMVYRYYNKTYKPDNVPFYVDGDITVNGIAYQIKTHKATFTNEKTITDLKTA